MQQQGYDRLSDYANKTLDKTLRAVEGSYYAQQLVIANMLEQVKGNYETVTGQINTIIDTTGTVMHDTTQDVVNEMPQQLDPLMTKFETYKKTLLDYIAQIVGIDENGGIKGLGESITGLAGEGGALATFKNAAQSDFGAATGYVNTTNGAVKTLYDNLFSFTGGDGIFAVFKEAAITHLTGSGGVTEALSQVGTSLDEMLGNLNSALSFNDIANITDSAQVTIGGIITDRIETLTTRSNEILNNIEKDVYDKIAGITEGIEPSEELNKGNKDYNYIEDAKKAEPKTEPKVEPKTEPKAEAKPAANAQKAEAKPASNNKKADKKPAANNKKADKKPAANNKKAEAKPAATPKATTIPLTAEMRDAVAAATWNGTLGWELNDPSARQRKYEELFGPNNGIQDVVNKGYKYANSVAAKLGGKLSDYSYENLKKKLQAGGFKKGTLGVPSDDTYWTHANEMIIRRSDGAVLTPLSKGSPVFPANLAENLWKWGAINPAEMMTKLSAGVPQSAVNNNITYNNHYDSLLTVNGDVDKEALPELKEILKQACEYTNKFNARESRKLGRK